VDEKAHDVARLEGYFLNDVKIGRRLLANLSERHQLYFRTSLREHEICAHLWKKAHVGVRVLLVKGFSQYYDALFGLQAIQRRNSCHHRQTKRSYQTNPKP